MRRLVTILCAAVVAAGCGSANDSNMAAGPASTVQPEAGDAQELPDAVQSDADEPDASVPVEAGQEASAPASCNFDYSSQFAPPPPPYNASYAPGVAVARNPNRGPGEIAYADPAPPGTRVIASPRPDVPPSSLTLPGYQDDMPLFDRGGDWTEPTRCYETPAGVRELTQDQAYDMYKLIADRTTGVSMDTTPEARTVVGLRGAYPGAIAWHGNAPNLFNDTLVLLWIDSSSHKHVREFPVNTDTGAQNFGVDSSSSLRANRRYHYVNGWHNTYNALHIDETDYRVRDDTNHNGHWDSDRNGWLPPTTDLDHDRTGSGHNIHMGSVDAPLGHALVDTWSAGCQVLPGMANWVEFITHAWTALGDKVNYFLIDPRDIPSDVWAPCTPDGSHECPYRIDTLPFSDTRDTSQQGTPRFDTYNCSTADESGPEIVYELRIDRSGTLTVNVDCTAPVDIDVYLLDGDDAKACLGRADQALTYDITPGRYLIVADTYVNNGAAVAGSYNLSVSLQ